MNVDWGALTRRLTERWRIVSVYAVVSTGAQVAYQSSLLLTDSHVWHLSLLAYWAAVAFSCWWNIWQLLSAD